MFWCFGCEACGILAPRPGIEPTPPALEGEVNHWTTREVHGLDSDGTNNRGNSPGPKMSKRMEGWGFGEMKADLRRWTLAWLGVGVCERGQGE